MALGFQDKILGLPALLQAVEAARQDGKTVVQCHGCFDIVHPGHIRYLEFARQQGDVLIVSLTGDSEISKGSQRPYIPQELRAENLAALMFVDYVHIDPAATAEGILRHIKPDVYVKGREYERSTDTAFLAEKAVVESHGGRMIFSSGEIVFSSSALIEQLPQNERLQAERLRLVADRHDITVASMDRLIEGFRDRRVLVVGDTVVDRYVFCDACGVASESPMMSLVQREESSYVGGAAIVARHVAALGGHATLLSASGTDERSKRVEQVLDAEGVEFHFLESRPTIVEKTRFLAEEVKLFKVDSGQRLPLDSVAERQAAQFLEKQSREVDAVIFCDFGYGMITGSLLSRVLPTLRHNAPILSADVSGERANMLGFRHVDLLCPTERELRITLNDHNTGLSATAWDILNRTQARHLLVTLEKRGMVVFERRTQDRGSPDWGGRLKSEQLPSFAENTLDRLGCGDALLAAATLALAGGADLMKAAYLGNAAAALEIAMLGNQPIEARRLREWLLTPPANLRPHVDPVVSAPRAGVLIPG